jgi:hypothetical protein
MDKMRKRTYLKPEAATIRFAAGEDVCIATGSGGTGEALSKRNFDTSSEWGDEEENSK